MEENGSKEPVEVAESTKSTENTENTENENAEQVEGAEKSPEDALEKPESEAKAEENSAEAAKTPEAEAQNSEKAEESPPEETSEAEGEPNEPKDAAESPENAKNEPSKDPEDPKTPPESSSEAAEEKKEAATQEKPEAKATEEAGETEKKAPEAGAEAGATVKTEKSSRFKQLAPKERNKEGRVAERLAKRQKAQNKELGVARMKWLRRGFSISLFSLIFYFGAVPYLKTRFYMYAAQTDDEERFFWAVDKLADNESAEAVSLYISGLQSKDKNRLSRYKKLIHKLATEEDRAFILSLLESKDDLERELGMKAFEILASKPWLQKEKELSLAIPMLIHALDKDQRPSVKVPRRSIIHALGDESHKPLIRSLMASKNLKERRNGLYVFHILVHKKGFQSEDDLKFVGKLLSSDPDKLCRIYACLIFEKLGKPPERYKPVLIQGTKDTDPSVRRICVETLAKYRDPELVKILIPLLKDSTNEVGLAAITALAFIDSDPAIFALSDLYDNGAVLQRKKIVTVFNDIETPDTTRILIRAMEDADEQTAALATRYLGNRRSRVVDPALFRGLESDSPFIRIEATIALGNRNVKDVIPILIKNLDGEDMEWKELQALTDALQKLSKAKGIQEPSRNDKSWGSVIRAWKSWYAKQKGS